MERKLRFCSDRYRPNIGKIILGHHDFDLLVLQRQFCYNDKLVCSQPITIKEFSHKIIMVIYRSTGLHQMHIQQLMWIIDGKEESLKESRSFLKKWHSLILLAQRPQPKQTLIAKVWHYTLIKID